MTQNDVQSSFGIHYLSSGVPPGRAILLQNEEDPPSIDGCLQLFDYIL